MPKLLELTPGEWSGPQQSGFGFHLVLVAKHVEGRVPALDEIRDSVLSEWQFAERKKAAEAFYQRLRAQYTVTVEMPGAFGKGGSPVAFAPLGLAARSRAIERPFQ